MSNTKREPLLSDEGYRQIINDLADGCGVDTRTPEGSRAYTTMSETARAVREVYEAARAKDAELIQLLVDALYKAPGVSMLHEGVCNDQSCGCDQVKDTNEARKILAAAEAAGFKPSDL